MAFEELSPNAEKLLQEIIEHRLPNGCCDSEHWKKRFENLSLMKMPGFVACSRNLENRK